MHINVRFVGAVNEIKNFFVFVFFAHDLEKSFQDGYVYQAKTMLE